MIFCRSHRYLEELPEPRSLHFSMFMNPLRGFWVSTPLGETMLDIAMLQ